VKNLSKKYVQALINLCPYGKIVANLVMAVASYTGAKSVIEYSESPVFHYQHSSIGKLFERLLDSLEGKPERFALVVQEFVGSYRPIVPLLRTQLDTTPVLKPHSITHADRMAVYRPNQTIFGNKPVEIGYNLSCLNIGLDPKWSIPALMERVCTSEKGVSVGIRQLQALLKTTDPTVLVVNTADRSYSTPEFMASLHAESQLVNAIRLSNRTVWSQDSKTGTGGAPRIYGTGYSLRKIGQESHRKNPKTNELATPKPSLFERTADESTQYFTRTTRNRTILVQLHRYNDMMLRSRKGFNMKNKPFDIVIVETLDADTLEPIHQNPIYLALCGQQKNQISLRAAYEEHYLHRYDIEPNNRFMKQQLLLDKFQTPIQAHFDLWLLVIQLAEWLLFVASDELQPEPKKWQKSSEPPTENQRRLTIAQTRKAAQTLFLTFDPTPFLPQIANKGKGRKVGMTFQKKATFKPVKKNKNVKKVKKELPKNANIVNLQPNPT
jgi:hypothetical protein